MMKCKPIRDCASNISRIFFTLYYRTMKFSILPPFIDYGIFRSVVYMRYVVCGIFIYDLYVCKLRKKEKRKEKKKKSPESLKRHRKSNIKTTATLCRGNSIAYSEERREK